MKTSSTKPNGFARVTPLAATLLLLGSLSNVCNAQPSPVGTIWDCVISGQRQGTAYLVFSTNGTFTGYEVIVPNTANANNSAAARNDGGTQGRLGTTVNEGFSAQQIFGGEEADGPWGFDSQGRTIGSFTEVSALQGCITNAFPMFTNYFTLSYPLSATNPIVDGVFCVTVPAFTNVFTNVIPSVTNYSEITTCYTNIMVCSAITNAISFVGKVVPGTRLTLVCSTPFGQTTYRGVPARLLPDISGNWNGVKTQTQVQYQEFLTLSPSVDVPFPNIYEVDGSGPGYSYSGLAVLSSQKKISFVLGMIPPLPTDPVTVVRAVTGPFNTKSIQANTKGWDQTSGPLTNHISFKARKS